MSPTRTSASGTRLRAISISASEASRPKTEANAETLPHRRKYLLLVTGFLRRLLDLHLEFVDEVESELAPERRRESPRTVR